MIILMSTEKMDYKLSNEYFNNVIMTFFKNKYRIESARLEHWNYANAGIYFVTICTPNMIPYFGKIIDEKVILNKIGNIAKQCWEEIPNHSPYVKLDEYIIMPNHVHGIIGILIKKRQV